MCLLCHGRLCLSSGTLTPGQSAVCGCGSSASLSPASRPAPQTSFGPLTSNPCVKALLSAVALPRRRAWPVFVIFFPLRLISGQKYIERALRSRKFGLLRPNETLREMTRLETPSGSAETCRHPCCYCRVLWFIKGLYVSCFVSTFEINNVTKMSADKRHFLWPHLFTFSTSKETTWKWNLDESNFKIQEVNR